MRDVYVGAMSAATALGDTFDVTWSRLFDGESAIAPVTRFATEALPHHLAACVSGLEVTPEGNRVCALLERALRGLPAFPSDTVTLWTGVKSGVDFVERVCVNEPPPARCLPRHVREWIAEKLNLSGGGLELNAACASSTAGIAFGAELIRHGECDHVLVCAADIVSRFTFTGFSALRGLSVAGCRPFDVNRDGLCLGDGAAAMLLTADKTSTRLAGWGIANDANHITGPARDGRGLVAAVQGALRVADLEPNDIHALCVHGTGTVYNDEMELTALERLFGERRFPAFGVKGAIGHTLGAAGLIESALCVRALDDGTVLPTCGLDAPEPRADGRFAASPQGFDGSRVLNTNSGFGGVNAALIFERL
jgi:3-oxoacyl-[acyl-carrier-protein] synthase II